MRVALTGGAYTARSVAAAAQRCVNLYSEPMPQGQGEPVQASLYPTPGLRLLITLPDAPIRGMRCATNGMLYVCAGSGIYAVSTTIDPNTGLWSYTLLGSITAGLTTPVSMTDNGLALVIVDGTAYGWQVTLATNTFASIVDTTGSFRGGDRATYLDTFFLFNVPGTPQFQSSLSLSVTFDALYFANKQSFSDLLISIVVAKREIWLLGSFTTEVWYNTGAAAFPFESVPGVFVDKGCVAKYSPAVIDSGVYWLGQDQYGQGVMMRGQDYKATRISTYAMEAEMATYATITDAVGFTYELGGHLFYVLTFPTADKTWVYDITTGLLHEWVWIDVNGTEHRHRANCACFAYSTVMVGDWQNGNLYELDPGTFTDNGVPIKRQRNFPHLLMDGKRVFYRQFLADLECGNPGGDVNVLAPAVAFVREDGGLILREDSGDLMREQGVASTHSGLISLCWSDDRGHRFGNPITQPIGSTGDYLTSVSFQRLGLGRDRVFSISWSLPIATVLQGAWVVLQPGQT